jgi:hypothetical protein
MYYDFIVKNINFKTFKHDVFEKILFKIFSNTSYLK